jgi:ABC-type dipeptide/oligopeptide/nickel transport system permease component
MTRARKVAFYLAKRLALLLPLLFGLSFVTFMLIRLSGGNPAVTVAGPDASLVTIHAIEKELHLDQPLLAQYAYYLEGVLRGDLGDSFVSQRPVAVEIAERLPITLELLVVAATFSVLLGVVVGFVGAMNKNHPIDHVLRIVSLLGISMPIFWLGLLLIFVFYFVAELAPPPLGRTDLLIELPPKVTGAPLLDSVLAGNWTAAQSVLGHMILPVLTIVLVFGGMIGKQVRAAVSEVKDSNAVRYAKACGLSRRRVWWIILHNASPGIVTFVAIAFSSMLAGSALTELIFSWGGLGQVGLRAVLFGDLWMVQGFVLTLGILTAAVYLVSDLVVAAIDPRVSW